MVITVNIKKGPFSSAIPQRTSTPFKGAKTAEGSPPRFITKFLFLTGPVIQRKSGPLNTIFRSSRQDTSTFICGAYSLKAHRLTCQLPPRSGCERLGVWMCAVGKVDSKEQPGHLLVTFWVWNTLVPNSTRHGCAKASGPKRLWSSGKKTSAPAGEGLVQKQRERKGNLSRHCADGPGRKGCHPPARPLRHPSSTA